MNNVTMETVASLHSPYGRVKVKPFNFSREVQSTKSGQSIHKGMVPLSTKSSKRTQKGADLEKNL
jgi:hypothetical protein